MKYSVISILLSFFLFACQTEKKREINETILASLGEKHKIEFKKLADSYEQKIIKDSLNAESYVGLAESKILLYVFGYIPRNECVPIAKSAFHKASSLDSLNSEVQKLSGILHFLDKEWDQAEISFLKSIEVNQNNLNARHWYALYLIAMKRVDEAMQQSDNDNENGYRRKVFIKSRFFFLLSISF